LAPHSHGIDQALTLKRLRSAIRDGQHARVATLLTDNKDLALADFATQVALLNFPRVSAMLDEDEHLAVALTDEYRPISHLAFSRQLQQNPELEANMLGIAERLVKNGANVNDNCASPEDNAHHHSVLYCALIHANNISLARWLIEHGANANDGDALYHATEPGLQEGLKLLLDNGANPRHTNALLRAMDFNDHAAVRLLLDAGADPDEKPDSSAEAPGVQQIPALHQAARRQCDRKMIELLLDANADSASIYDGTTPYAYARVYGNTTMASTLEARNACTELSTEEELLARAADNSSIEGLYVNPDQLPECYRNMIRQFVHMPEKLDHIKRLVAMGMEYDRPDLSGVSAVQVAGWCGLPEMMAYLLSLKPDLSRTNRYGGTLLSAIIHGSKNCPERTNRQHLKCAQLALEEGLALPAEYIDRAGSDAMCQFLSDWAAKHPGQVEQELK